MATMGIEEAERILDIVSRALQDRSHRHCPISALKGYDLPQIDTALKLRIANEYLLLANKPDFETQFKAGVDLYDGVPWTIMSRFVPDDQVDLIGARGVFAPRDGSREAFAA